MKPKFCVDCTHYKPHKQCIHPKNDCSGRSLVTKEHFVQRRHSCSSLREDGWLDALFLNTCGKHGKWFEAR